MRIAIAWTAALAVSALAGSPSVGQDAPEFGNAQWVMNAPDVTSIAELRGEVIFIEKWGVKCPPCLALIPHVEELQRDFGGRGLHIFAFEAQGHSAEEIQATMAARGGKSYPVAAGGAPNYETGGGIPHGWLVGVDGKIIWEGHPGDAAFDKTLKAELAKVKFPGLGLTDVDKALEKSVKSYLAGDLAKARTEAQKVAEGAKSSEEAKKDAEHILARIQAQAEKAKAKAESLEAEKLYVEASKRWNWLKSAFGSAEEGKLAAEKLKSYQKDAGIAKEIEASEKLAAMIDQLSKGANTPAKLAEAEAAFKKFAEKYAGTKAAEDALAKLAKLR